MLENDVPAKLKHVSAQVAMDPQSAIALSHALALSQVSAMWGQQSGMSVMADISVASAEVTLTRAPAAAGSIATDRAIRSARMVRPMLMWLRNLDHDSQMRIAGSLVPGSSDDFAMGRR